MSRVAAVILAGGKAERLGGLNKALLQVGGARLIDRAIAALHDCDPVLLAVGRADFAMPGVMHVPDLANDYEGPLAGLAAAVDRLLADPPELLLSMAVDTPFFPHDFLRRALPLAGAAPVVLAAFGAQDYPTNALWRFSSLRRLADEVRDGTAPRSLKRLAATLGASRLDYAGVLPEDPFQNANTPADLALLRARAERPAAG